MKRIVLILGSWCLLLGTAWGQQPHESAANAPSLADVTPTPTESMWLYVQESRRYDDPRQAVRRKAEERAQQRRDRIATMKRLGLSKQRPWVTQTPFTSFYSPRIYQSPYVIVVPPSEYGVRASSYPGDEELRR